MADAKELSAAAQLAEAETNEDSSSPTAGAQNPMQESDGEVNQQREVDNTGQSGKEGGEEEDIEESEGDEGSGEQEVKEGAAQVASEEQRAVQVSTRADAHSAVAGQYSDRLFASRRMATNLNYFKKICKPFWQR